MDAQREFQSIMDEWASAIVDNDADRIGWFATPDWLLLGPEGGIGHRDRFLALVAAGELVHTAMELEVLEVRRFGDAAVVITHGTNAGTWLGHPFGADEWATNVFVRRDGRWLGSVTALTPNFAASPRRT
ncbi:Uncharacterised protein [Nocardia otitidiscaviarum]|uniref:DUF4440 domain-containing protein n=1 Tax=Nocardia otitidiscaviarum TaxID=1823 RepID=A0A379JJU5_9NOCA|nr:nuclear transport factor 2 family protein [Nocardia otitidiscaviarum]SUD48710.1 Uncharacterised protein [Nocardia otitidiscaviarum]